MATPGLLSSIAAKNLPVKAYLLINPLSGSYTSSLPDRLLALLQAAGISAEIETVTGPQDALRVGAALEAASEHPLIIVAGGDGTFNAVVNAITPRRCTLAILPVGTANVLAHELGIRDVADGIARIARGESRPLSVADINGADGHRHRFILMAGVGLDGRIVDGVREWEKRAFKKGAYLLSALRCLLRWDCSRFTVQAAGHSLDCHSIIIGNASRYGGNLVLMPDADLFEPQLELFCVTATSRWSYLRVMACVLTGHRCRREDVTRLHSAEIQVSGDRPIQLDGDYYGTAPVSISTLPAFARMIV